MRTQAIPLALAIVLLPRRVFISLVGFMFSRRNCRQSREESYLRKFCLVIISLALVSIHIQAQNGWTKKTTIPTLRGAAIAEVINGKIYIIGGNSGAPAFSSLAANEIYDPIANKWEQKSPMPTPRGFFASGVVNDTIYTFGGGYSSGSSIVEAYDPATDTWWRKANMLNPRFCMRAAVVDGTIYLFCGNYNERNCQAYDPATNKWTEKTPMPSDGGGNLSVTAYNNALVYTFGGSSNSTWSEPWQALSTVYEYNPEADLWTKKKDMPTPRFGLRTYLVNGKIYAIGGSQSRNTSLATVEVYDPVTDTWETKPNMPFNSFDFAGAVVDNKIYVISGSPDWATGDGSVWEYDPAFPEGIEPEPTNPMELVLCQNYPNPFNPTTTIKYELPNSSVVMLSMYDLLGREASVLVNERKDAGVYEVKFDGSNLASGVYLYQIQVGDFVQSKKLIILK